MALAIPFSGEEPPKEFRIFSAGVNTTRIGDFLFDEKAAADVMAAYKDHGIDIMIDLEHLSLDDESRSYDPDARGWCKLELRNGELWAADVAWTPDGDARLREKRQRYISPVFLFTKDKEQRVTRVVNVAITALPATDHLEPLVAASLMNGEGASPMTPEQFAAIAEALGLGADANVEDVIATIAAMVKKVTDAANGNDAAEEPPAENTPAAAAEAAPPVAAAARIRVAALSLVRLSGKKDLAEVVHEVEAWRTSHLELEKERAKVKDERNTMEASERRRLVGELVKLGVEIPATAWADDEGKTPAKRFVDEPIAELRARVAKLTAAKAGRRDDPARPPATGEHGLSERELAICAERKIDPAVYAKTRAGIKARNANAT